MPEAAAGHQREILRGQAGEGEGRAARAQHQRTALRIGLQLDLGTVAQLADNIVERMRRRGRPAVARDQSFGALDDFQVHVRGTQAEPAPLGLQEDVGEDRNRVPALDDALDMAQRPEQRGTFDGQFHGLADRTRKGHTGIVGRRSGRCGPPRWAGRRTADPKGRFV